MPRGGRAVIAYDVDTDNVEATNTGINKTIHKTINNQ